ncbi:MAG TPA: glycosyltransferase family 4 protein [Candidatus Tumulicola sp.]|jgi:glycosyltransferase involved in cell wall biosynthesis
MNVETPKSIAIVAQFYEPEPCAASNRLSSLAQNLADRGHRVTVFTGMPSFPWGKIHPDYRGKTSCTEYVDGVRIERRRAFVAENGERGGRARGWISLSLAVTRAILSDRQRFDTVVVSSPPITMTLPALLGAWRHRARLVIDVRDVFPDMGVRLGVWKADGPIVRALGATVGALYRHAALIVAVTPSARRSILAHGVPAERVLLAPNGFAFSQGIVPRPERSKRRPFTLAYAGNMGLATGLGMVLDAAALLRDREDLRFVLAGGGLDAAKLQARIGSEGLNNVEFRGVVTRRESLELLALADATIVPLHRGLTDAIPSKMFDALAIGCPMILSASGESVELLARSQTGLHVEPNDAQALARGIVECCINREALEHRSIAGQTFVREHFDRDAIMGGLAQTIGAIA